MVGITVGICAYNEEKNIGELLRSLLDQKVSSDHIIEKIIVVSSACIDGTNDIVRSIISVDNRIMLVDQKEREGKASAINIILRNSISDVIILVGADVLLVENTIDRLISPFSDSTVGMTGGHPIPVDSRNSFIGHAVHTIWELHHELALKNPKLGEIISFRNIIDKIPDDTAVDEATIESIIKENGLKICYVPDAIVYNKGASTIEDFIIQRRRIHTGHLHLHSTNGYKPSSMSTLGIAKLVTRNIFTNVKMICWTIGAVGIETWARTLAIYDFYIMKKNPYVWKIAKTTKKVVNNREKLTKRYFDE